MVTENQRSQKELLKTALVDTVRLIKEEKLVEDVTLVSSVSNIPNILMSIGSQMAMLSVAQKIRKVPVIDELVTEEIINKHEPSLPLLGFRAFKTAVENQPLLVESDVLDYLDTQDLGQDKVQQQLATVLNVAHQAMEQVIRGGIYFAYLKISS